MLTRCPQCHTLFKVSASQMKARGGLVRCGRCHAPFDALQMLIEAADDDVPIGTGAPHQPAPAQTSPQPELSPPDLSPGPVAPPDMEIAAEEGTAADLGQAAACPPDSEAAQAAPGSPLLPPDAFASASGRREPVLEAVPKQETGSGSAAESAPAAAAVAHRPKAATDELVQPPTDPLADFLQEPPAPRRWPWWLGSTLAFLALAVQAAIALRVELAVLYPPLKPLLVELCAAIGCQVELPRRIELVSIETSSLHPGSNGRLELVASLRNRAPFAQQYPHLEVTLTDAADRPIVRRVFAPREWLPADQDVATGFAADSELTIELALKAQDIAPAGYRLYIFHP